MAGVATFRDLCLDARDPQRVAAFWAAVLGREVGEAGRAHGLTPDAVLRPGLLDPGPVIWVNGVPEDKVQKVRLHVDVDLRDGCTPADLVELGATVLAEPWSLADEQPWWVLADPEGNEFCAFPPEAAAFDNDADAEA